MELIKVGDLARATNRTVRTLRYYEELGLLRPARRSEGGFRLYAPQDTRRVEMITELQELGLSLEKIASIVRSWQSSNRPQGETAELRKTLEEGHKAAHGKIDRLRRLASEFEIALGFLDVGDGQGHVPAFMDRLANG